MHLPSQQKLPINDISTTFILPLCRYFQLLVAVIAIPYLAFVLWITIGPLLPFGSMKSLYAVGGTRRIYDMLGFEHLTLLISQFLFPISRQVTLPPIMGSPHTAEDDPDDDNGLGDEAPLLSKNDMIVNANDGFSVA